VLNEKGSISVAIKDEGRKEEKEQLDPWMLYLYSIKSGSRFDIISETLMYMTLTILTILTK
jgi:hypothetical protein